MKEAELAMMRRLGAPEGIILVVQSNLANTYASLGRIEESLLLKRDVYSATLKLYGEEHLETLREANNYTNSLCRLERYAEAKALLRKTMPVAQRVLGENNELMLKMRWSFAEVLCRADGATLGDTREAVATLEDLERTTQRVMGGAHPTTASIGRTLQNARAALSARETQSSR